MASNDLMTKFKGQLNKVGFAIKKASPEICMVAGIGCIVGGTILACRATLKAPKILEVHEKNMDKIRNNEELEDKEIKKQTTRVYCDTFVSFAKLYGPAVFIEVTGILLECNGFRLEKRDKKDAMALAASTASAFASYREYIRDKYGDSVDKAALLGLREETVEVEEVDENGKTRKKKKKVPVATAKESPYLKYFTKSNPNWKGTDDLNEIFFRSLESWSNDKLRINGRLTLEDVYRAFGFKIDPKDPMCLGVGWIFDEENPMGDNRIAFHREKVWLHNDDGELEEAWAIDFNVDGDIYKELCSRNVNAIGTGNAEKDILNLKTLEGGM